MLFIVYCLLLTGPIQSLSWDVCESCVCVSVPLRKPRFPVDWRLWIKEGIANNGIPLDIVGFFLQVCMIFCVFKRVEEKEDSIFK